MNTPKISQENTNINATELDSRRKTSRRTFIVLGAAAAMVGAGEATRRMMSNTEQAGAPIESEASVADEVDRIVEIDGVQVNIDHLSMPDFYTNTEIEEYYRPWADPRPDLERTVEERAESIRIDSDLLESMTDEELSTEISHRLERIANAARDPEEYYRFINEGTDNSWEDHVRNNFIAPMIEALFPVDYDDPRLQGVKDGMIDFFVDYADEYETALRREDRHDSATIFVSTNPIDINNSIVPNERSLYMELEVMRPALSKKHGKGDKVLVGDMTVNIHDGIDSGYEMGVQQLNLKSQ